MKKLEEKLELVPVPISFKAWATKADPKGKRAKESLATGYGNFCTKYRTLSDFGQAVVVSQYD